MHSQAKSIMAGGAPPPPLPSFIHGQTCAAPAPGPSPLSVFARRLAPGALALALSLAALLALSLTLDSGVRFWEGGFSPGYTRGAPGPGAAAEATGASGDAGGVKGEEGEEGPDLSRPSKCPEGCLDHGTCNEETGECHCVTNYGGPACADHALPRCQLAPGYTSPCHTLTTCECVQDCHRLRLPLHIHCLRGTLQGPSPTPNRTLGTQNPNAREVLEGGMYWVPWDANATTPGMPDYKAPPMPDPSPLTDPASCPESCNGHGACHRPGNYCECPWVAQGGGCGVLTRANAFMGASPACFNGCSDKGECVWGVCRCRRGYFGLDCSLYIDRAGKTRILRRRPYSWASLPPPPPGASLGLRPRVYVYDLPGYFNTWQQVCDELYVYDLPGYLDAWQGLHSPGLDWEEPVWFLERLLNSPYRTADPDQADFFYIPLFIRNRDLNKANLIPFVVQYIRERWPHYDRSGGRDHIVMTNSDWGNCQLGGPDGYGAMSPVLDDLMTLTLWGMSRNMTGGERRPCFRPGRDIVIPPLMEHDVYKEAPDFPHEALSASEGPKDILLYFRGSDYAEDKGAPGEYRKSFGARQELARHFGGADQFNRTGVLVEGMGGRGRWGGGTSYLQQMRRAVFCFAPAGWGWAMRTTQAAILGCIPLVVQPDVVQPFQGDGLDWSEFAVTLRVEDVQNVDRILRAYSPEQVLGMQRALLRVRRRFAWSSTNFNPFKMMGKEAAEAGAEALLNGDSFIAVMEALRLRLKT